MPITPGCFQHPGVLIFWSILRKPYGFINDIFAGSSIKLEDAIRAGDISLAEIFAYARTDAENGFCEVSIRSKNGLSSFLNSMRFPLPYNKRKLPGQKRNAPGKKILK